MKKLCVLFGGESSEHDISVITGMQLAKNIKQKYDVEKIYIGLNNNFYLATKIDDVSYFANKEDISLKEVVIYNGAVYKKGFGLKKLFDIKCAINCCHGGIGENGDLAGFLTVNKVNFTSSDALSSHIAMDKSLAKALVKNGIDTVKGVLVDQNNKDEMIEIIKREFSDNLIVKPNSLGSSIGVKVCTKEDFAQQINAIFLMNDSALVEEQVVDMVEFNQAAIKAQDGLLLSAIEQPITKHQVLTFSDKYTSGGKAKDRAIPADISPELEEEIINSTKLIYEELNLNGVVRIDYIYDNANKKLYFNEVNTIPGSMAYYLFEPVGIDYISLVELLVENCTNPKKYTYFKTDVLNNKKI